MEVAAPDYRPAGTPDIAENPAPAGLDLRFIRGGQESFSPPAQTVSPNAVIGGEAAELLNLILKGAVSANATRLSIPLDAMRKIFEDFLFEKTYTDSLSPRTIESYTWSMTTLDRYLVRSKCNQCGDTELKAWFADMVLSPDHNSATSAQDPGARTREMHYINLRVFFNWAVASGFLQTSPLAHIKKPKYKPKPVLPFEPHHILKLIEAANKSDQPKRDIAIIMLTLDTGIRASELCALRVCDVDFRQKMLHVAHGKGDKARWVRFCPETMKAVWAYLHDLDFDQGDPLFLSQRGNGHGGALTRSGLEQIFRRLGIVAGVEGVRCSPHTMRHAFASIYMAGGGFIEDLRILLGHETDKMARKYVTPSPERLRQEHARNSPVNQVLNAGKGRKGAL